MSKQRDRGRILTPASLSKLQQAIRAWETEHECRCTQDRIREVTSAIKEGGLDPGTIRKIQRGNAGVDPESIRCFFQAFGLKLTEADLLVAASSLTEVDRNFVGREEAIADLNLLANRGAKVIVIQARGGVGKTTLARKYLQQEFSTVLEFPIAKETKDIASIESLIEEKLRQLDEEPGREFLVSIDRLKRKLKSDRIGILIDNLEPALDSSGKFIEAHRRYVELLRVLADPDVKSLTLITSRERIHEPSVSVQHYPLRSLDASAWEQFFQERGLGDEFEAIASLHHAYGGNAKAMDLISSIIYQYYAGSSVAYWQENQDDLLIERDLEDLVTNQFNRLAQVDPEAYNLLCRIGCYRYQDVPTVPIEGILCLLWDVPENRRRRVVKSLQERSLVEFKDGEFWLHPVIRSEAIGRLKHSQDWEIVNRKAALFWTESIQLITSLNDLLQILEASFHYLEIEDFEATCQVLVQERENKWTTSSILGGLSSSVLGYTLFFFGALQKVLTITEPLLNRRDIKPGYSISMIYSTLGDMYYAAGSIKKSLECYRQSGEVAIIIQNKFMELASLTNQGLCKVAFLEFETAEELLKIPAFYESKNWYNAKEDRFVIIALSVLAYIKSCTNSPEEAIALSDRVYSQISVTKLGIQGAAYRLLFLGSTYKNLSMFERSHEMYSQALLFAQESQYRQLEARALTKLAELYREQQDSQNAYLYHLKAVSLLRTVGAKWDLAEACYQLGVTNQKMNKLERSYLNFRKAIRLFSEIEAPKQVERVRRSMEFRSESL